MPDLTFTIEMLNAHSGQTDWRLVAQQDGEPIGSLDYSVYRDEPAIQMIRGSREVRGVGVAMVKRLQAEYPGVAIRFGMLTPDGAKMLRKLPMQTVKNPDYTRVARRLARVRKREQQFQAQYAAFEAEPTEERRMAIQAIGDQWNDLNQQIWELENELRELKPSKRLVVI